MHIVHVMERFNPFLGQEINIIAKNHSPSIKITIVTSKSLSTWQIADFGKIHLEDLKYKEKYNVEIIRLSIGFERGEKIWLKKLIKTVKGLNPDIIYVHGIEYISFFRILFYSFFNSNVLVTDTHSLPIFTKGSFTRKLYYSMLKLTIFPLVNYCRINVFYTTEENKLLLKEIYGIKSVLINPFQIGADFTNFFFTQEGRIKIRANLAIGPDEVMILYSGRLTQQKGPHLLLEAFSKVEKEVKYKVRIVFIGFQDKEYIQEKFGNQFNFLMLNPVPSSELRDYFSAADIAVYPLETTLSALECQACRLPVIMENNPTNCERIKEGGILYEKNNIDDLAKALLTLINNPELRKQKGNNGYTYVTEFYDYERNLRQMETKLFEIKSEFSV